MQTIRLSRTLPVSPDRLWTLLQKPATMQHVCRPLITFRPLDPPAFPEQWQAGEYRAALRLFGLIPVGWQVIGVAFPPAAPGERRLHDSGSSPLMRTWEHQIRLAPAPQGTRYTDRLTFDAGALSPLLAPLLRLFFAHRQRRLAQLARDG